MELIDTHAHLDLPELYDNLEDVLERAAEKHIVHIVTVGIDLKSSMKALEIASGYEHIFATGGIHPHGAHRLDVKEMETLCKLLSNKKVVALGEIGLDYYRDRQPREIQKKCFIQQLEMAVEAGKPAIFHVREAFGDFLNMVTPYASRLKGGIVHCFSGDWSIAKKCFDLGFLISVPGVVTYPNAHLLQDVVKKAPLESILTETDAPFLAPTPHRGKPNEPSYVFYTASKIAELKNITLEEVGFITANNARRIFGISTSAFL